MTGRSGGRPRSLAGPLVVSVVLHGVAVAGLILVQAGDARTAPPIYRVRLVAAQAGERAIGARNPPREAPPEQAPPARAQRTPPPPTTTKQRPPERQQTQASQAPPREAKAVDRQQEQVKAGGGEEGGRGSDVANVDIGDIEFPWQGYLNNIVNQIAMGFPKTWPGTYRAQVTFLIERDGKIRGLRLTRRSGSYEFDLMAQAAVEAAARRNAFGPLPSGYVGDVLPVVFSFDPRIIR